MQSSFSSPCLSPFPLLVSSLLFPRGARAPWFFRGQGFCSSLVRSSRGIERDSLREYVQSRVTRSNNNVDEILFTGREDSWDICLRDACKILRYGKCIVFVNNLIDSRKGIFDFATFREMNVRGFLRKEIVRLFILG